MSKQLHSSLQPYFFNKARGISFEDTTATLLAEDLLNPNNTGLALALEVAIEAKIWSIVESILNLKESVNLLSEDNIQDLLRLRPETFKGKLHLLTQFDCNKVTVIAPISVLCEHVLSFKDEDISELFPEEALESILGSPESIPYRLKFLKSISKNSSIYSHMQSDFLLEALRYNATLPLKEQVKLDRPTFQEHFLKLEFQLARNKLPYAEVKELLEKLDYSVKPTSVWLEEADKTDSILDTFVLPESSFKDVRVTQKILGLLEASPIEGFLKYVSRPLDQDTLCKIVWDCPYSIVVAHVLSTVDLVKNGKRLEKLLNRKTEEVDIPTLFSLKDSALLEFFLVHCRSAYKKELMSALSKALAQATETDLPKLISYVKLLGFYQDQVNQFVSVNIIHKHQFNYLGTTPTRVNLKHALTMQSKKGTKYLLQVVAVNESELLELIDSCVIAGWHEGVAILATKLSAKTRDQVTAAYTVLLKDK